MNSEIFSVPAHFCLPDCVLLSNLIFTHSSLTSTVSCHKEAEEMQMREEMHSESGEAERRVREGAGLPALAGWLTGWVCGCQTKTSGGQVENIDYTERSAGVKEGPLKHRWKDLRLIQVLGCKVKANSLQGKCSDKGKLTFNS